MTDTTSIAALIAATALADLKVDQEFRDRLPALSPDAKKELRTSIEAEGIREPLTVWKEEGLIVDGHNRYDIAMEMKIVPPIIERSFRDRSDAIRWMAMPRILR